MAIATVVSLHIRWTGAYYVSSAGLEQISWNLTIQGMSHYLEWILYDVETNIIFYFKANATFLIMVSLEIVLSSLHCWNNKRPYQRGKLNWWT